MIAKKLIATAVLATITGACFAGVNTGYADHSQVQSTRSRADVIAELEASQADGTYIAGGAEFDAPTVKFVSTRSREDVIAELERSKTDGSFELAHQEFNGQFASARYGVQASTQVSGVGKSVNAN